MTKRERIGWAMIAVPIILGLLALVATGELLVLKIVLVTSFLVGGIFSVAFGIVSVIIEKGKAKQAKDEE